MPAAGCAVAVAAPVGTTRISVVGVAVCSAAAVAVPDFGVRVGELVGVTTWIVDAAGGADVDVGGNGVYVADGVGADMVGAIVAAGSGVSVGTVSGCVITVSTTTTVVGVGSSSGRTILILGKSVRMLE